MTIMKKGAVVGIAALVATGGHQIPAAAAGAPYNSTVRVAATSKTVGEQTTYAARYTVSNRTHSSLMATVTSPSVPGLACSVVVPARGRASCSAQAAVPGFSKHVIQVVAGTASELQFTPANRTVKRARSTTGPTYPARCYEPGDSVYFDCGDPAPTMVGIQTYAYDVDPAPMQAGVARRTQFAIFNQDWQRGFYADITSPRFGMNSGRMAEPMLNYIRPGERLEIRHYSTPGFVYEVTVIPTPQEAAQGYMEIPVTLTSVDGSVYSANVWAY